MLIYLLSAPRSLGIVEQWHWGRVTRVGCAFLQDGPGGCLDMRTGISSVIPTLKITLGLLYPPPHWTMLMKTKSYLRTRLAQSHRCMNFWVMDFHVQSATDFLWIDGKKPSKEENVQRMIYQPLSLKQHLPILRGVFVQL